MLTSGPSGRNSFLRYLSKTMPRRKGFTALLLIALYSCLLFFLGALASKLGFTHQMRQLISLETYTTACNYIEGLFAHPERITIDIRYNDFEKLRYKRHIALQEGILVTSPDDFVPAKVTYLGKTLKVKLRLKGDQLDHLQGDKWSFRIKVTGTDTLLGMKRLSIQHPATREYLYEWLFHQVARREGLISLRYKFINVTINGEDLGLYALEEHFDKTLIENNRRREGPIIKFDESLWWAERLDYSKAGLLPQPQQSYSSPIDRPLPGAGNYYSAPIDMFHTRKTLADPELHRNYLTAQELLDQFRRRQLSASQVFDVAQFAKYIALCDLFGTTHPLHTNQFRFYYNPVLSLLEPIPFDIQAGKKLTKIAFTFSEDDDTFFDGGGRAIFLSNLFEDYYFFRLYITELERFSDPSYIDTLFTELDDEVSQRLRKIYSEFPHYRFCKNVLYKNQEYIKRFLNPVKGLHAYFVATHNDRIELQISNIQQIPIEVLTISCRDSGALQPTKQILLRGRIDSEPAEYQNVTFLLPDGFAWSYTMIHDLKLKYALIGTQRLRYEAVFPWPQSDQTLLDDVMRKPPNFCEFTFLVVDNKAKRILFKSGEWELRQDLIIPRGYEVIAGEGLKLNLCNSAKILSYSPLTLIGSRDHPILFYSSDSDGQGMAVINTHNQSVLEYVHFSNLSNPSCKGWQLTGALTFYESPVRVSHCQFRHSRSEDALNIIRTEFLIENTLFSETLSDALDADFCDGKIVNCSFVKCGNDALDVSGSALELSDILINGAGDKGLSVGENSRLTIDRSEITKAHIAIASKDMSRIIIDGVRIHDATIGLAAFQKKPEFGSASIAASNLLLNKVDTPYLVETGSTLTVDGRRIESTRANVKRILYAPQ